MPKFNVPRCMSTQHPDNVNSPFFSDSEVLAGEGVGASILDRVPLVMIGRHGTAACFAAALEPIPAGQSPTITSVKQDVSSDHVRITVQKGNRVDQVTLSAAGKVTVVSDGKEILAK